jgi:hypothetical protein
MKAPHIEEEVIVPHEAIVMPRRWADDAVVLRRPVP